ncbi:MAG TPA: hypothetical protein VHF25_04740, partial [Nitriliruptorales bacterium]|nr:hypothetical protein [Nitriliruptorales bacterium]
AVSLVAGRTAVSRNSSVAASQTPTTIMGQDRPSGETFQRKALTAIAPAPHHSPLVPRPRTLVRPVRLVIVMTASVVDR